MKNFEKNLKKFTNSNQIKRKKGYNTNSNLFKGARMHEQKKKIQPKLDDFVEEHDENFAQLLAEFEGRKTALTQGKIVEIKDDEVFVDIGQKSEGVLPLNEIKDGETLLYKVGDELKVAVVGYSQGRPLISHKKALRKEKINEFIQNFTDAEIDKVYEVKIIGKNKGGYVCVDESGIEFFLPKSQYTFKENNAIGKKLRVKVLKIDKDDCSIVVSRRKVLDEERKKQNELVSGLTDNSEVLDGVIKKITSYGMFVDVGGIDGLVHYSELSHRGHINPSALYKEGDKVQVKALRYDKKKKQLSLSVKATLPDPWDEIKDNLEVGDTIKVTVSNLESYGAFVDIGNEVEGFLHISEMSWDKGLKHPKDCIQKGQELDVEVIEINPSEKRLRVSLRNLLLKPFDEFLQTHSIGDVMKGKITSLTNFGAFVRLGNVEGLLHNEDCSWNRQDKCTNLYKVGDEVEVKIVRIDKERQKISLSTRELVPSPIQEYMKGHKIGDIVKGKVKDIKEFGVFVELGDNVDALIHKEDISQKDIESLKVGDEIEASILVIDEKRYRMRLSVKNLNRIKEREVLNEINSDEKVTLGDIIKEQLS